MQTDLDFDAIRRRLKQLREQRDEDQADVAAAIDVARATVAQYEAGTKRPGRDKLARMAAHFGVSTDELLFGDQGQPGLKLSPEEERLVMLFRACPAPVQSSVSVLLENAAEVPGEAFAGVLPKK